jgi:hypothetical protein
MIYALGLFLSVITQGAVATTYKTPPAVLYPQNYTTWVRSSGQSRLAMIDIPFVNDNVKNKYLSL